MEESDKQLPGRQYLLLLMLLCCDFQVVSSSGAICVGAEEAQSALLERQEALLWDGLRASLLEEAQVGSRFSSSAQKYN